MRHRDPLTAEQERELDALDRALAGDTVDADLRDLEALVRDVRATAPEMSPGFAARLQHEVAEGFPTSQERVPLRGRGLLARRWVLLPAAGSLAAVLVALVVVFGDFGAGTDTTQTSGDGDTPSTAMMEEASPAAGGAGRLGGQRRGRRGRPCDLDPQAPERARCTRFAVRGGGRSVAAATAGWSGGARSRPQGRAQRRARAAHARR